MSTPTAEQPPASNATSAGSAPAKGADPAPKGPPHPWRENIEAITMAIVVAIFLKYFVVEAYKIPTGSMQPTLMGNAETGIFDRILVDKFSYHYRDPERFEVVVFKYPLDRSKNFIKRLWGMPGEWLTIRNGDVLVRPTEDDPWRPVRRPDPVQSEAWRRLDLAGEWAVDRASQGWDANGETISASGPGKVRFPRTASSVTDLFLDGYPTKLAKAMRNNNPQSGLHEVGDLRIEGRLKAQAGVESLVITLREHTRHYRFEVPGPAAPAGSKPSLAVQDAEEERSEAETAYALPADRSVAFVAQNLDDLLTLEIAGEVVLEVEIDAAREQRSSITLELVGAGGSFDQLEASRDIYYTQGTGGGTWQIPEDSYMMLGDNTQDSADSREWRWARYELQDGAEGVRELRGQLRSRENPQIVAGRPGGTEIYFRDDLGERYVFGTDQAEKLPPEDAPFVPRELITGRALLVFWPLSPKYGVYRMKWIR